MTAARTPSQRGRAARTKGHDAERALCRWLRTQGWPDARRPVDNGWVTPDLTAADPGDVADGGPGLWWSVKSSAQDRHPAWLAELAAKADGRIGLLVVRRVGHADPARWWCWLTLAALMDITDQYAGGHPPVEPVPVRMELGHLVPLLRAAGHGEAGYATARRRGAVR